MTGRALVTGASSGIGLAIAVALAGDGWELELLGRDEERLARAAERVERAGGRAATHRLELRDDEAVRALALPERLDALVHAAGTVALAPFEEADLADLDGQYEVNVRAPYHLTQRALPALRRARGQVVFVNSGAGLRARGGWSGYAASKFALRAVADALRDEVAEDGIRVASVYPGRTASPMQEAVRRMENAPYEAERYLRPEDVAAQVRLLLSLPPGASIPDVSIRPS